MSCSSQVPNIDDVAGWIGNKQHPKTSQTSNHSGDGDEPIPPPEYDGIEQMPKALVFKVSMRHRTQLTLQFGDEFRPVPLKLHAMGTDAPNEFALSGKLDKELFPVLNRYSDGLPTLVFCPTRKGTPPNIVRGLTSSMPSDCRAPLQRVPERCGQPHPPALGLERQACAYSVTSANSAASVFN